MSSGVQPRDWSQPLKCSLWWAVSVTWAVWRPFFLSVAEIDEIILQALFIASASMVYTVKKYKGSFASCYASIGMWIFKLLNCPLSISHRIIFSRLLRYYTWYKKDISTENRTIILQHTCLQPFFLSFIWKFKSSKIYYHTLQFVKSNKRIPQYKATYASWNFH